MIRRNNNESALGKNVYMDVIPASAPMNRHYVDADNFYPADGDYQSIDMYYGDEGEDIDLGSQSFFEGEPDYYETEAFEEADGDDNYSPRFNYDLFGNGEIPSEFNIDENCNQGYSNATGRRKSGVRKRINRKRPPNVTSSKRRPLRKSKLQSKKGGESKFEKVMSYTPIGMVKKAIDNRFSPEGKARAEERKSNRRGIAKDFMETRKMETEARVKATEALSQADPMDAVIAQQFNQLQTPAPKKKLTTLQITGIAVGSVALLGTIAYFVLRNKK